MERDNQKSCTDYRPGSFRRTEEDLQIKPAAFRGLLRNRDFLFLWMGQMISAVGDWIIVAVLFAYVDQLSGGRSYAISLMMLSKFLPAVLLGFLAGVIIDRLDRRSTLILCDLSRAALVVFLPFAGNLLFICILVFAIETFTIIYGPAKDASIPDLVEPQQLTNANSMNMLTLYASMAFGTALAGSIIGFISWLGRLNPGFMGRIDPNKAAFFLDSLTFLASAWLIYHIGFKKIPREERVKMTTVQVRRDFREGFRYLWGRALTRTVLLLTLACFLGGGTIYVLTVSFVRYVLGGSGSTFMYILTTLLFGMMSGSVLAGAFRSRVRKERVLGLAISGFGAGVVLFSILSVTWISFLVAFLGGVFMGYAIVGMVTLLHERLDEEYRGRAFATIQVIMRASIFVSIMLAGPLADLITGLGRRLGLRPLSLWLVRLGGSYQGEIDGRYADFRYLLNGPQLILLVGGLVIFAAGVYGQRSFHRHFAFAGEGACGGPLTPEREEGYGLPAPSLAGDGSATTTLAGEGGMEPEGQDSGRGEPSTEEVVEDR